MNPVSLIDLLTFLGILAAFTILATGWKRALARDTKLILMGLLVITLFHGLSNVLEWSGTNTSSWLKTCKPKQSSFSALRLTITTMT